MKKRIVKIVFLICIVLVLGIVLIPFPQPVFKTYDGIRFDNGKNEEAEISVKGWYLHYLLKNNRFIGTVKITPYQYSSSNVSEWKLNKEDNELLSSIIYFRGLRQELDFTSVDIAFDSDFSRVIVLEYGPERNNPDSIAYYSASENSTDPLEGFYYINNQLGFSSAEQNLEENR